MPLLQRSEWPAFLVQQTERIIREQRNWSGEEVVEMYEDGRLRNYPIAYGMVDSAYPEEWKARLPWVNRYGAQREIQAEDLD